MSVDINTVVVSGNLVSDPALNQTQTGISVCNFRIASNRGQKKDGSKRDPLFIDVTAWNGQGENCAKFLRKGRKVTVVGKLELTEWADKTTGEQRRKHVLVADPFGVHFGAAPSAGQSREPNEADAAQAAEFAAAATGSDDDIPF